MKKIISILVLSFGFIFVKAQTPKILIAYDANGNRILRQYLGLRPTPSDQLPNKTDTILAKNDIAVIPVVNSTSLSDSKLKVYPNPSNDNFNILVSDDILKNNAVLTLVDQLGRQLKRGKILSSITTISTKEMADGVYTIIIQYGLSRRIAKIVKSAN